MEKQGINNIKLGVFVLSAIFFFVLLLFMIGKNRSLFGNTYLLKARFENIQGLVRGNKVRFSGIEIGTVKNINILRDTMIEVSMNIEKKMMMIIQKNAIVSIGTEGLVGNKVVNIIPSRKEGPMAVEGDLLTTKPSINTDEILEKLNQTNQDIGVIVLGLKTTVQNLNNSNGLWTLLDDPTLPRDIKSSLVNLRTATGKAALTADELYKIVLDVKNGKGSVGTLLTDTSFAGSLNNAVLNINHVGNEADSLIEELNRLTKGIRHDVNDGNGMVNALLKDSSMAIKLNASLDNLEQGTDRFNQNMEALKHNFLFSGYYNKQEKHQKEKAK